jgi:DDE superfamily endonuclease
MLLLPTDMVALLSHFAPLCTPRTWRHVPLLVVGALLAPGRRMVSTAWRAIGLAQMPSFQTYHRVLNRAVWSSQDASRVLLRLLLRELVKALVPTGPLIVGIDETLERRRGRQIGTAGIDRDPVRSSRSHFVKVRGLRWMCAMLLVPIPWAGRVWALPFLTVLAPAARAASRRRCNPLTAWARQMIRQLHRWAPERRLVVVGDRPSAALERLDAVRSGATVVARLRRVCGTSAAGCAALRATARAAPRPDRAAAPGGRPSPHPCHPRHR